MSRADFRSAPRDWAVVGYYVGLAIEIIVMTLLQEWTLCKSVEALLGLFNCCRSVAESHARSLASRRKFNRLSDYFEAYSWVTVCECVNCIERRHAKFLNLALEMLAEKFAKLPLRNALQLHERIKILREIYWLQLFDIASNKHELNAQIRKLADVSSNQFLLPFFGK